ncbi:MAG: NAD(P)H-hydrate dehydratase [Rhodospirillaceae bacterium]|nr:NAD(P)H-hydrate dehydratase [Rhodospirillaceae bacterium]
MLNNALLSVSQMTMADNAAIAAGIAGVRLMEAAGKGACDAITNRWQPRPVIVLCGPGNNGGDGFVVARLLAASGWPVRLASLGDVKNLKGDAAINAEAWTGPVLPLDPELLGDDDLVVDALFGAGLSRPLEGEAKDVINAINQQWLDCVGIDVPSGVDGDSGEILGSAPKCVLCVTFFRRKPGHLLLPGRELMGEVVVVDIGIPETVLEQIKPDIFANGPGFWLSRFPRPQAGDNKYDRGHALIVGGAEMTGAARLAATAARRIGAGLATIAAPAAAIEAYAAGDPGNIISSAEGVEAFEELLSDRRKNVVLIGPGCGRGGRTRDLVLAALGSGKATVLDADALSVFSDDPETLFAAIATAGIVLLTPHDGEFRRIFNIKDDKLKQVREASLQSGAVVLLKGADTVIAAPDGRAIINEGAPPTLATAGSGDVLAGFATGLLAQTMDAFDAAAAACWLHGQAAMAFGPGLIAEDLAAALSGVLRGLEIDGNNQS